MIARGSRGARKQRTLEHKQLRILLEAVWVLVSEKNRKKWTDLVPTLVDKSVQNIDFTVSFLLSAHHRPSEENYVVVCYI
jgi:hypothetical protein